jgi:hypothetical protein
MDHAVRAGAHLTDAPSITLTAADLAAIDGLRRLHEQRSLAAAATGVGAAAGAVTVTSIPASAVDDVTFGTAIAGDAPTASAATCPIPGVLRGGATSCPVQPGARTAGPVQRSRADLFVRRLLRIKDRPVDLTDGATYRAFRRSMTISAIRCTLTYVVFPIILPGISFLKGVGPLVGIFIGSFALVCDTFTIRRFFAVDHRYRWYFSTVAFGIMCLLSILLVQDISHVVGELVR